MSNSSLVVHTNISPNKNSPRNATIQGIAIHCVAGQVTAESLGNIFKPSSRQASSNYGVDKDGRVGMYVEEKDRSWCTSSANVDNRCVTIEVSSDNFEPYKVTDKALSSLIKLCADICQRNGIKKLLWKADKTLMGQYDKQNMVVHRWTTETTTKKSCPGNYLYERHGYIADEVNKLLGTYNVEPSLPSKPYLPPLPENIDQLIWDFFRTRITNDYACAGIMGNLYAESGLNPRNLQNSYNTALGMTDEQYTTFVDNGTYPRDMFINDKAGYGLAQFTFWSLKQELYDYCKSKGTSISDLQSQLEYLYNSLSTDYAVVWAKIKNAKSVREASDAMLLGYERPADQSESVQKLRASYGQTYYDKFAKTTTKPKPDPIKEIVTRMKKDGITTDTAYWTKVLQGKENVNPEYLHTIIDRYNVKLLDEIDFSIAGLTKIGVSNTPDYWENSLRGEQVANSDYIIGLIKNYQGKLK